MTQPIRRVSRLAARVAPFRWDWAEREADAIARHWEVRKAQSPAIFDGRVLMVSEFRCEGEAAEVTFFETGYAQLLAHVDAGCPDPAVANGFAMGALRTQDGSYVLGRMGGHTANAGKLYFPAGTPDLSDVLPDGSVDLAGSILREIEEETGLGPDLLEMQPAWTIVWIDGRLALMRDVALTLGDAETEQAVARHFASQALPELDGIVLVRSIAQIDEAVIPAYLTAFLRDRLES